MSVTLLTPLGEFEAFATEGLRLAPDDVLRTTGWTAKPEGLCLQDQCVPWRGEQGEDGRIDLAAFWRAQGHPVLSDDAGRVWVLGTGAHADRAGDAALTAPDFELPDVNGVPRRLSDLRGRKVFLVTWAPWCGCKTDLPVWQSLFDSLKDQPFMVVAVAQESSGPERARPWYEKAGARYWQLVDAEHRVSELFGLVNVPQAVWIDERGRIARPAENPGWPDAWRHRAHDLLPMTPEQRAAYGFMSAEQARERDEGRQRYAAAVRDWVLTGAHALPHDQARSRQPAITPAIAQAQARFRLGVWLRRHGSADEGDRQLEEASRLHPQSWTIWRQAADLAGPGKVVGTEFLQRMAALGDKPYYPAPQLPGF